jgi:hypothetical protein
MSQGDFAALYLREPIAWKMSRAQHQCPLWGHKQTFAMQLPTATAKADFGKPSCLLYFRKQTCAVQ